MTTFDFATLSPVERLALADALYDSAMREIDALAPTLTPQQLAELDRRIAEVESEAVKLFACDQTHAKLIRQP